jgi:hypothetical protein
MAAFDEINYSMTLVADCYIDLLTEKLQIFPERVNPDSQGIVFPLASTS